jgi:hypothetical protein
MQKYRRNYVFFFYEKFVWANILAPVFMIEKPPKMEIPTLNQLYTRKMRPFSRIFSFSFSTQNPRASARGQKSGFFQFEESGFQQTTIIFYCIVFRLFVNFHFKNYCLSVSQSFLWRSFLARDHRQIICCSSRKTTNTTSQILKCILIQSCCI